MMVNSFEDESQTKINPLMKLSTDLRNIYAILNTKATNFQQTFAKCESESESVSEEAELISDKERVFFSQVVPAAIAVSST